MLPKILPIIFCTLLTPLLIALPCEVSAETELESGGMVIKADVMTHDQNTGIVQATGNIVMEWKGMTLASRELSLDRNSNIVTATGNVVVVKGNETAKGERLVIDTDNERGEMDNGTLFSKQKWGGVYLSGEKIVREGDESVFVSRGTLTTCDGTSPFWKIGAKELKSDMLEYGTGNDAIFYIKETPVMYLPWIAFPVARDRQSGFLLPVFGWSKKRGGELDLRYYWAIDPSQDMTFHLDSLTRRGVGTGVDYRYLRSRGSDGYMNGYLIHDFLDERWRGKIDQKHTEILSGDMNFRTSVNLTTDRRYLDDYGEENGEYNKHTNDSTFNLLKTWQNYALTANVRYTQDYYAENNRKTLQTLPELGISAVRQQIFSTPLYFDMDMTATSFYRENGVTGERFAASPRLTFIGGIPGYLNGSAFAGIRGRAYHTTGRDGENIDRNSAKALPEAGASISTTLARVYEVDGESLQKLRHEIVPEISFYYSPHQDQSSLPLYDYNDRLLHQNIAYFGITSHLGGKFRQGESYEYRDISRISLMQGYSIDGNRRDLLTAVDVQKPWSDLILTSETWLDRNSKLAFDSRFNLYEKRFSSVAPGIELDNGIGSTASLYYRMSRDFVEYLEARVSTKAITPWTFGYTARYSFDRSAFLESVYSAEYRHQCWSVNMAFRDRHGSPSFLVNFNLAGLGENTL